MGSPQRSLSPSITNWRVGHVDTVGVAIATAVPVLALASGLAEGATAAVYVLAASLVVGACLFVPTRWLPLAALVTALVIPYEVTKYPVSIIPLAAWAIRAPRGKATSPLVQFASLAFGAWFALAGIFATTQSRTGHIWVLSTLVAVVLPTLRGARLPQPMRIRRWFLGLTSGLAGFAVIEKFVLKSNPIYGHLYKVGGDPIVQTSVYRATTLLGHPLVNGAVFATASVLAVDEALTRSARLSSVLRVILLVAGLAATLSRGATATAVIGIGLLLLLRRGPDTNLIRKIAVIAAMTVAGFIFVGGLIARNDSSEGQNSTASRSRIVSDTEQALRGHELLGVGPGTVQTYRTANVLLSSGSVNATNTALESTYAELLVGAGIPGFALFLLLMFCVAGYALRSPAQTGAGCCLLTYVLSLGTFKTEGHVQLLVLLGILLSMAAIDPSLKRAPPDGLDASESAAADGRR